MVAKNFCRALDREDNVTVRMTDSCRRFMGALKGADAAVVNTTKFDDPRFSLRLLGSILVARIRGVPVINVFTTDIYDLCDNAWFKPLIYLVNFFIAFFSNRVLILDSRGHIARRYLISPAKTMGIQNYVDNAFWGDVTRSTRRGRGKEIRVFARAV